MSDDLLMRVGPDERVTIGPPPYHDYHLYGKRVISFDKDLNVTYVDPTLLASPVRHILAYHDVVSGT